MTPKVEPEECTVWLRVPFRWFEGTKEQCAVIEIAPDRYRLQELIGLPLQVGDEFEARRAGIEDDGVPVLEFVRRTGRSGHRKISFVVARGWREAPVWSARLERLKSRGGHWCTIYGGILLLSLPPGTNESDLGLAEDD